MLSFGGCRNPPRHCGAVPDRCGRAAWLRCLLPLVRYTVLLVICIISTDGATVGSLATVRRCLLWRNSYGVSSQGDDHMSALWYSCCRFLRSEDGPTAVEYAFMLALIIMVCVLAVRSLGTSTSTAFSQAGAGLPSSS
jgi:pilus assembly protein Flp/PilA